ncbi:MAG: hypothetical protein M3R13_00285 [Armatimonadota bacterium]|nr:hypothetical protein [Armatimonadota bacterium]
MKKSLFYAAFAAMLLTPPAFSEEIGGVSFANTQLTVIDSNTGAGVSAGNLDVQGWNSLESVGATFYGTTFGSGNLYSWNFGSFVTTFIATIGDTRGLAWDGSTMWGVQNGNDDLVTIDLGTGAVTPIGSIGFTGVQAIAVDAGGNLFGWDINTGLLTINSATGQGTDVSTAGGTGDIQGMDFATDGTLYGAREQLYTINTGTGAFTAVGGGGYTDIRGIATNVVPEPATLVCVAGMLLALAHSRRRH